MAIWLITRTDDVDYDEHYGIVVRANSEKRAMEIAVEKDRDAPPYSFYGFKEDGSNLRIVRVNSKGPEWVILKDFRAG